MSDEKLPTRAENYSEWYNQVVLRAEMADYAPVRGCMVVRPYGWALWENIQQALDRRFKADRACQCRLPAVHPHVLHGKREGTRGRLLARTGRGDHRRRRNAGRTPGRPPDFRNHHRLHVFAKWIKSYRDLPVLINQWANVVRWEMRTRLFLRTLEFYWQEGHTAHATAEEAEEETRQHAGSLHRFRHNEAAVPVIPGLKSHGGKICRRRAHLFH